MSGGSFYGRNFARGGSPRSSRSRCARFRFSIGPACLGKIDERVEGDRMLGDPGVQAEDFAGLFIGDGEFEPVRQKGVVRVAERTIGHKAKGQALPDDLVDPLAFGLSLAPGEDDACGFRSARNGRSRRPIW